MLMIEGPKFSGFDFTTDNKLHPSTDDKSQGTPFLIHGRRILLAPRQGNVDSHGETFDESISHTSNTAKSVWDCSIVMSKYLEALSFKYNGHWEGKRTLELGAGQGLSSFSAAALGAKQVIITDVVSAVPSLEQGVQLNELTRPRVQVRALDWTNPAEVVQDILHTARQSTQERRALDYILASDVIWVDFLIEPLINTIAQLMETSSARRDNISEMDMDTGGSNTRALFADSPVLLLAHQSRSARCDSMFFEGLDALGLQRKKIKLDDADYDDDSVELDPMFRRSNLAIWKVWRQ
ncbi:hypothetical protein BGZ94_003207 [Podila epigama]|nr:hypothetical protein BGZ94_003207 [Podila epigama]